MRDGDLAKNQRRGRLDCRRRSNAIDTLTTHRSAVGNKDAVWFGVAAFAYETDPDLVGRMWPFGRTHGMRDDAIADCDAFITDECRRAGNELSHRALRIVAERATNLLLLEELQDGQPSIHPHRPAGLAGAPPTMALGEELWSGVRRRIYADS